MLQVNYLSFELKKSSEQRSRQVLTASVYKNGVFLNNSLIYCSLRTNRSQIHQSRYMSLIAIPRHQTPESSLSSLSKIIVVLPSVFLIPSTTRRIIHNRSFTPAALCSTFIDPSFQHHVIAILAFCVHFIALVHSLLYKCNNLIYS